MGRDEFCDFITRILKTLKWVLIEFEQSGTKESNHPARMQCMPQAHTQTHTEGRFKEKKPLVHPSKFSFEI